MSRTRLVTVVTAVLAAVVMSVSGCATVVVGRPSAVTTDAGSDPVLPTSGAPRPTGAAVPSAGPAAPAGSTETTPWPPATIPESQRADPEIVDFGFTAYDVQYSGKVLSYAVRLRNPNESSWVASSVNMILTFTDDAGNVLLKDELATAYTVVPGATAAVGGTAIGGAPWDGEFRDLTGDVTKMSVELDRVRWFSTDDVAPGTLVMGPATVRPGADDSTNESVIVTCDAISSYRSKLGSGSVVIVYLDATGKIIGGNAQNSDIDNEIIRVPGQARTPVEMELLFSLPDGVPAAQCYPSFVGPI